MLGQSGGSDSSTATGRQQIRVGMSAISRCSRTSLSRKETSCPYLQRSESSPKDYLLIEEATFGVDEVPADGAKIKQAQENEDDVPITTVLKVEPPRTLLVCPFHRGFIQPLCVAIITHGLLRRERR